MLSKVTQSDPYSHVYISESLSKTRLGSGILKGGKQTAAKLLPEFGQLVIAVIS